MSGTQSLLSHLSKLSQTSSISIVDSRTCHVVEHGEANPTSLLQLSQVLYVPNFPINLLSISAITKPYFTLSHSFLNIAHLRICERGRGLVWGMRLDVSFMSLSPIIF